MRLGVQEMTRYGMKLADFESLAELIARVLLHGEDVRSESIALRGQFLEMQYCLPADESIALAMHMLEPMFPVAADAVSTLFQASR